MLLKSASGDWGVNAAASLLCPEASYFWGRGMRAGSDDSADCADIGETTKSEKVVKVAREEKSLNIKMESCSLYGGARGFLSANNQRWKRYENAASRIMKWQKVLGFLELFSRKFGAESQRSLSVVLGIHVTEKSMCYGSMKFLD